MRLHAILLGCAIALVALAGWYLLRPGSLFSLTPTSPTPTGLAVVGTPQTGTTPADTPTTRPELTITRTADSLPTATATAATQATPTTPPLPSATVVVAPSPTATVPIASATPTKTPPSPTPTPTRTPTQKPLPTMTKVVPPPIDSIRFGAPKAAPSQIYYGAGGCKPTSATIRQSVSGPSGVSAVSMRYGPANSATNAVVRWIPQSMTAAGGGWTGEISTVGVLSPDLVGSQVHIWVYFVVTDGLGVQTNSPMYKDVLDVSKCTTP